MAASVSLEMIYSDTNSQFLSLIEAHKGIIYKISNTYCRNPGDRQDLAQEIVLQLWKAFPKYNDDFKYSTWMYRIALNVAISFYRKETTRSRIANPVHDELLSIAEEGKQAEQDEKLFLLKQFIAGLKDFDKALMLLYLEEKSTREMSEIMGITESNVLTKISRIKKTLSQKFSTLKKD